MNLKETLERIHTSAATEFLGWLEDGIPVWEDGEEHFRRPNAQEMNAMIKFLKDNGIDRLPGEELGPDDPLAKLIQLATKRTHSPEAAE